MSTAVLSISLDSVAANWHALNNMSGKTVETAAVVKADGYGLDARRIARRMVKEGVTSFFVAAAEEASAVRDAAGENVDIYIFSGHMRGDTDMIADLGLIPLLNSIEQLTQHFDALPGHPFGIQLDTGMNRLGMEPEEWLAVRDLVMDQNPKLIMSHLACADEPENPMNAQQLAVFREMTDGLDVRRSLAATGGVLLGSDYHFDMTRPGIGLYGGRPFEGAVPAVHLSLPVIQIRHVAVGETVGYGGTWTAKVPSQIATVAAGYADGLHRALTSNISLWHEDTSCPLAGRVSMDMMGVDVTHLDKAPAYLDIICPHQGVDDVADAIGTIGYEILTSLGHRYTRRYIGI